MRVSSTATPPTVGDADTIAVGVFEGGGAPDFSPAEVSDLLDAHEARATLGALALAHAEGRRWLIVGLGARERFDAERARVVAAAACARAREISTRVLGWSLPDGTGPEIAAGLVQGVLTDYRFDRAKGKDASDTERDTPPKHLEALEIASGEADVERAVAEATVVAEAANRARDLQTGPPTTSPPRRWPSGPPSWPAKWRASAPRSRAAAGSSRAAWARSRRSPGAPTRSPR